MQKILLLTYFISLTRMTTRKWQNPLSTYFVTFFKMCLHTQITVWNILFAFSRSFASKRIVSLLIRFNEAYGSSSSTSSVECMNGHECWSGYSCSRHLRYVKFSLPFCSVIFGNRMASIGPNCYAHHKRKWSKFEQPFKSCITFGQWDGTRNSVMIMSHICDCSLH